MPDAANLLAAQTSPYLLQHKDNPVHWRPWGPEALAEAKAADRPILLSIGYAACHWCHVMAHESFEDDATAALMNDLFVNIKVDREERPDIDGIYMAALHAFGEQGGWPMTMFLTPDGEPFWGGTYFPPEPRWGRPSFQGILREVSRLYREDRKSIDHNRAVVTGRLAAAADEGAGGTVTMETIDNAARALVRVMDPELGGTRGAPKFPQFALFELIARYGLRQGDERFTRLFVETLQHIFQGGIYDHLGGGLARYSVDDRWLVPHFEKMLYDNARAIDALTLGHQIAGLPLFRIRIEETIAWLEAGMLTAEGAFASSLDADSEGEEGRFYVWTKAEIAALLGDDAEKFSAHYDVTDGGNWEGKTILNRLRAPSDFDTDTHARCAPQRARLIKARNTRIPPGLDDKVLTDWNGLAIAALANAGAVFGRPDWIARAESVFRSVAGSAPAAGRLLHSARGGTPGAAGLASDYASLARAAATLFETTGDAEYLHQAETWLATLDRDFADGRGGYYLARIDATDLIVRPRTAADDPTPNANAVVLETLARLECFTGNTDYGARAEVLGRAFSGAAAAQPFAHAFFLNAAERAVRPLEIVIVGDDPRRPASELATAAFAAAAPTKCITVTRRIADLPPGHPAMSRPEPDGTTAYVCANRSCSLPITTSDGLADALAARN